MTEAERIEKTHPDFPEWIKSEEGEKCMLWPIAETKYLHNRLFWAFDAGRNCVWQQYINQESELASLRQQLKEKEDHADTWKGEYQTARRQAEEFRKQLKASQELNREMAEALQFVVENHGVKVTTVLKELIESLIQKYKGQ